MPYSAKEYEALTFHKPTLWKRNLNNFANLKEVINSKENFVSIKPETLFSQFFQDLAQYKEHKDIGRPMFEPNCKRELKSEAVAII